MKDFSFLLFSGIFGAMFIVTFVHTLYLRRASQGRRHPTAIWSAGSLLLSLLVIGEYIRNFWIILPAVLGDFCGAELVMWLDTRKKKLTCSDCAGPAQLAPTFGDALLTCPLCHKVYKPCGSAIVDDKLLCTVYLVNGRLMPLVMLTVSTHEERDETRTYRQPIRLASVVGNRG